MTITITLQDLLALIQIQAQLISLIQTHQALLAKLGFTSSLNGGQSTSNSDVQNSTKHVALHTSSYGPAHSYASLTSPSGFPQQLHSGQPGQMFGSTLGSAATLGSTRSDVRSTIGSAGSEVLCRLLSSNSISCTNENPHVLCHACQLGKHVRLPFISSNTLVETPLSRL
ncbi:hypothetical protein Tco_0445227 [Tanacetum coccineum]